SRKAYRASLSALLRATNSRRAWCLQLFSRGTRRSVVQRAFRLRPPPRSPLRKDSSSFSPSPALLRARRKLISGSWMGELAPEPVQSRKRRSQERRGWPLDRRGPLHETSQRAPSWPTSEETPDHLTKARKLTRKPPAQQQSMTVVVQSEATRKTNGPVRREIPSHLRGQVMRSIVQTGTSRIAQTSIHLHSGNKILPAEITAVWRSLQREGMAGADRIRKLPRFARRKILGKDGVHRDVPAFESAG